MADKINVLALDLEGTLISNAVSQIPRPGLYEFLDWAYKSFPRVVMFTTVSEEKFRPIANLLASEKEVPDWFREIEYVEWSGQTKDLSFIPGVRADEALLMDDFEVYVHPGQENQWISIKFFDYPYDSRDNGLAEVMQTLKRHK